MESKGRIILASVMLVITGVLVALRILPPEAWATLVIGIVLPSPVIRSPHPSLAPPA